MHTIVVDMAPHAGDRAVGLRNYVRSLGRDHSMGRFVYLAATTGAKGSQAMVSVAFSEARLAQSLAKEWFERTIQLTNEEGKVEEPQLTVPEPTEEELSLIPGGKTAYAGAQTLKFEVCHFNGAKVQLKPEYKAEFANAQFEVSAAYDAIHEEHEKSWADMLTVAKNHLPPNPEELDAPVLKSWESLDALKREIEVKHCVKQTELQIDVLWDSAHNVYLLDPAGDRTLIRGTHIGGHGSGALLPYNPELDAVVPFLLSDGDRSLVQLAKLPGEPETAAKFTSGTLFQILRTLEGKGFFGISLTRYGQVKPTNQGGSGRYEFPDEDANVNLEFVPKAGGEANKDNIFRSCLRSSSSCDVSAMSLRSAMSLGFASASVIG